MSSNAIFGTSCSYEDATIIIIPVPWDVTTSYGGGASLAPQHILEASPQLDFFDLTYGIPLNSGIHMLPIPQEMMQTNSSLQPWSKEIQKKSEEEIPLSTEDTAHLQSINKACSDVHDWVEQQ